MRVDFISSKNYKNFEEIIKTFPKLNSLKNADERDFSTVKDPLCFVIRSNNDDDIHKVSSKFLQIIFLIN